VDYVYHQNPDMFYFSGYSEPNSMMYILKEEQKADSIKTPFNEVIITDRLPSDVREGTSASLSGLSPSAANVIRNGGEQV
jgi:Xaa-Pro aminopeptidase